jgi:hypothetical protein
MPLTPGISTGYWNARNSPSHARSSGASSSSERGLARAVGSHDRVDLAGVDRQIDAFEDLAAIHRYVQILDFE